MPDWHTRVKIHDCRFYGIFAMLLTQILHVVSLGKRYLAKVYPKWIYTIYLIIKSSMQIAKPSSLQDFLLIAFLISFFQIKDYWSKWLSVRWWIKIQIRQRGQEWTYRGGQRGRKWSFGTHDYSRRTSSSGWSCRWFQVGCKLVQTCTNLFKLV